jgi:hypothetical protein
MVMVMVIVIHLGSSSVLRPLLSFRLLSLGLPDGERYDAAMTREQIKAALDRVLTWPPKRQEDVAKMIVTIEEQDTSPFTLTDEQVAEVRRRRAEKDPETLTLEEFVQRLRRFGV